MHQSRTKATPLSQPGSIPTDPSDSLSESKGCGLNPRGWSMSDVRCRQALLVGLMVGSSRLMSRQWSRWLEQLMRAQRSLSRGKGPVCKESRYRRNLSQRPGECPQSMLNEPNRRVGFMFFPPVHETSKTFAEIVVFTCFYAVSEACPHIFMHFT